MMPMTSPLLLPHSTHLHCLAQPHVISQDPIQALLTHAHQPAQALHTAHVQHGKPQHSTPQHGMASSCTAQWCNKSSQTTSATGHSCKALVISPCHLSIQQLASNQTCNLREAEATLSKDRGTSTQAARLGSSPAAGTPSGCPPAASLAGC